MRIIAYERKIVIIFSFLRYVFFNLVVNNN
jgi:hypothetical protein